MAPHVDNKASLKQVAGDASTPKANHSDVRSKFVCDYARRGIVLAQYVLSKLELADLLMKVFDYARLAEWCKMLRLGKVRRSHGRGVVLKTVFL